MTTTNPKLIILNPINAYVDHALYPDAAKVLSYSEEYFRDVRIQGTNRFKKMRKTYNKCSINKKTGIFPAGLAQRVAEYLTKRGIDFELVDKRKLIKPKKVKKPDWVEDRQYQVKAVEIAEQNMGGVIIAPTGSGKTVITNSILSRFPKKNILILVHTISLLYQLRDECKKWFPDVGMIGDGVKKPDRITVATVQTLHRMGPTKFHESIDVVFHDEAHHLSTAAGTHEDMMRNLPNAVMRFGLTATKPTTKGARFVMEGSLGPIIYEIPINALAAQGFLAKPKIRLVEVPPDTAVTDLRRYEDVYEKAITKNRKRNRLLLLEVNKLVLKEGRTCLIMVNKLEHMENLYQSCLNMFPGLKIAKLHGASDGPRREQVRQDLIKKKINIVIVTSVWKEGVDIPTLGAVINGGGGMSEIATLQTIGRGLRAPEDKEDVVIVDFFDSSHHYLVKHFGKRVTIYMREGWL